MTNKLSLTFIGGGNLTNSLVKGILHHGYPPALITVSDPHPEKLTHFAHTFGIHTQPNNHQAITYSDIVILAVKPTQIKTICQEIRAALPMKQPLIISVAAGITLSHLLEWLGGDTAIIRAMPNTASQVLQGVTGLCANKYVTEKQCQLADELFQAVGITAWFTEEDLLNVVTALSGSGTAYYLLFMEAMADAASELGLNPEIAKLFSLHTALGAAKLATTRPCHLRELREQVTSPNGTTAKALHVLETADIRHLLQQAMQAAYTRSIELSKEGST